MLEALGLGVALPEPGLVEPLAPGLADPLADGQGHEDAAEGLCGHVRGR